MKRIVARKILKEFWEKYTDSEQYLKTWYKTVKNTNWKSPNEVNKFFPIIAYAFTKDNQCK